ncbi:MAG: hypothetical protein AB7Q37_07605 [Pyrinomonadaceae bacterium]
MKRLILELINGKDGRVTGLVAMGLIGAVALGCTCNKWAGDLGETNSSNSTTVSNTTKPADEIPTVSRPDASKGEVPTDPQSQMLARETILDFNDAIQSGDFSTFHGNVSKPFQRQASAEKMEDAFKAFIEAKPDFSDVKTMTATFSPSPSIQRQSGVRHLQIKGYYETSPRRMNFDLKYIPEGKDWKLISIEVNTRD